MLIEKFGISVAQFLGSGRLIEEADAEPILGLAADGFEADAELHLERYRPLARFVARRMEKRRIARPYVVEMGPGPGIWAAEAAKLMPGAVIDCFDLSPDMVEKANRRFKVQGFSHRVAAYYQDMRGVHQETGAKADMVFSRNMLHRLPDLYQALLAMLYAANNQGEVFVTCFLRVAQQDSAGQRRFWENVASKADFPELQLAYVQAHVFAHSLEEYRQAAQAVARVASARFQIWTGGNNEVYLHFLKGG
ncbi:MAG TPA: class I SAM-dependent methyltransferase [Patescibacteria group bacterium]